MARFTVQISRVVTNGPYSCLVFKDGVGQKDTNALATVSAALDQAKADVGALLASETVQTVAMNIISS